MWLNDNLIKFIESSSEISKLTIFISDLKQIKFYSIPNKGGKKLDKIISRELLENLLRIGTGIEQDKYILINSENEIIPLIDNENINLNIKSQIILPIWVDNELKGTITFISQNRNLDEYDLELARSTQIFVEESILNSLNEEFLKQKETKKGKMKTLLNDVNAEKESKNVSNVTLDENDM